MRTEARPTRVALVVSLAVLLAMTVGSPVVRGQAEHVRWDIVHLKSATTPFTLSPGGVAYAFAGDRSLLKIKLTGSGTFVAPASGGPSSAVTGGGTWETFNGTTSTGSGTYWVTRLVSWQFANFATGTFIDNIGDITQRANGNAVLLIQYSDGSSGIVGILCHGPGAPAGIVEGVIATKGYVTYVDAEEAGAPSVDKNRTIFHFEQ